MHKFKEWLVKREDSQILTPLQQQQAIGNMLGVLQPQNPNAVVQGMVNTKNAPLLKAFAINPAIKKLGDTLQATQTKPQNTGPLSPTAIDQSINSPAPGFNK
jgi:hypothetical protein